LRLAHEPQRSIFGHRGIASEGRLVMLSSEGHRRAPVGAIEFDNLSGDKGYQPLAAYGQSKIANLLFAKELQRRFAATKKTAYAVHPGVVDTNLHRSRRCMTRASLAGSASSCR
jgi:WW domain-containing oxidoreductase